MRRSLPISKKNGRVVRAPAEQKKRSAIQLQTLQHCRHWEIKDHCTVNRLGNFILGSVTRSSRSILSRAPNIAGTSRNQRASLRITPFNFSASPTERSTMAASSSSGSDSSSSRSTSPEPDNKQKQTLKGASKAKDDAEDSDSTDSSDSSDSSSSDDSSSDEMDTSEDVSQTKK